MVLMYTNFLNIPFLKVTVFCFGTYHGPILNSGDRLRAVRLKKQSEIDKHEQKERVKFVFELI